MVRTAIVGLALLLCGPVSAAEPWEYEFPDKELAWARAVPSGSVYYVAKEEVSPPKFGQPDTILWMHGMHSKDATVTYRTSVWRLSFDCNGRVKTLAFTLYGPRGNTIESWDGYETGEAIRPDTMYADLEKTVCAK